MEEKTGTFDYYDPEGEHDPFKELFVIRAKTTDVTKNSRLCAECGGIMDFDSRTQHIVCTVRYRRDWLSNTNYKVTVEDGCGNTQQGNVVDYDTPSFNGSYQWQKIYYNPMNHFTEWIKRVNGLEQTTLPRNMLRKIVEELEKRAIPKDEWDNKVILEIMQIITRFHGMDCRSFYENIYKIRYELTGVRVIQMTFEQKDTLCQMFQQYKSAFYRAPSHIKNGRTSLQEYSYLLYMFCLIQKYDDILPHLHLIQGKKVILEYNNIFEYICEQCGWPLANFSLTSIYRDG